MKPHSLAWALRPLVAVLPMGLPCGRWGVLFTVTKPEPNRTMKTNKLPTMTPASLCAMLHGELDNFVTAATPGGIERQEKQGQIEQGMRETLPIDGTFKGRGEWQALGFVFGEPADDLFVNVKFPEGWKKNPTDHSMWTDILDDKGRKRGAIFYKAAFYDRSAHCYLTKAGE